MEKELKVHHQEAYKWDVRRRIPDTSNAKEKLGFKAKISLDESLNEIIGEFKRQLNLV